MSLAVVFAGQGTQHADMLPWLASAPLLQAMERMLGCTDWRGAVADPAWAAHNAHAQVLLTGTALAAWDELAPRLPAPVCIAGYSVGELAAFSAAGVFDAQTALVLAQRRAAAMDRCGQARPGGLLALAGLAAQDAERLCGQTGLAVAIRNGPDSVVVGGPPGGLAACERLAVAAGAQATRLAISVASHTPMMREAVDAFAAELAARDLGRPRGVLFSDVAGRIRTGAEAARALARQIAETVRWDECMDDIRSRGPSCVLEVGAGQALSRMWNRRHPDVPARACDEFRSVEAISRWVDRCA